MYTLNKLLSPSIKNAVKSASVIPKPLSVKYLTTPKPAAKSVVPPRYIVYNGAYYTNDAAGRAQMALDKAKAAAAAQAAKILKAQQDAAAKAAALKAKQDAAAALKAEQDAYKAAARKRAEQAKIDSAAQAAKLKQLAVDEKQALIDAKKAQSAAQTAQIAAPLTSGGGGSTVLPSTDSGSTGINWAAIDFKPWIIGIVALSGIYIYSKNRGKL